MRGCLAASRVALVAGGMALVLTACAGRIWRDEADAGGVRLHWYTGKASIDEAQAEAARYCQASGGYAELQNEFIDHDVTVARFACR